MPGLLEDRITPQEQGMQQQNMPPGAGQETPPEQGQVPLGEPMKAKPEQQRVYDMYVGNGLTLVHSEKTRDSIISMLKRGKPVDAVANATLQVMARVDAAAESEGIRVPDEVKLNGGNEIMGDIIMIGEASKAIPKLKEEEREAAFRIAVGRYLQNGYRQGKYTPRQLISSADKIAAGRKDLNLERDAAELAPYIKRKTMGPMPSAKGGATPAPGATPGAAAGAPGPGAAPQTPMPEEQLRR